MKVSHILISCLSVSLISAREQGLGLHRRVLEDGTVPTSSVAVVGAGISGLTAAYHLKKLGYNVTVFEALDRVGGKIESEYHKDGVPAANVAALLDEETEAKAQELCGNERPTELGAVLSFGGDVRALADELGVPYAGLDPSLEYSTVVKQDAKEWSGPDSDNSVVVKQGTTDGPSFALNLTDYVAHVASHTEPGEDPTKVMLASIQAFFVAAKQFPEIASARLDGNHPELAMSLDQFAAKYGFSVLVDILRPQLTGYGYGYTQRVPAGILLKAMHLLVPIAAGVSDVPVVFPCGFQSLIEALAKGVDVRLGAKVSFIERKKNFISVKADGEPMMQFDHLVISTTLDLVPTFLDVDDMEAQLFGKLSFNRYLTTLVNIDFNRRGQLGKGLEFYVDQGFEENKNSITLLGRLSGADGSAEVAYQIVNTSISKEEAVGVLDADMASYWQGSVGEVIAQREWPNYFPTVSTEDFANGFYDDMESLQGRKNTYYVGSQLSFETVYHSELYAKDLISRKFPLATNATSPSSSSRSSPLVLPVLMAAMLLLLCG